MNNELVTTSDQASDGPNRSLVEQEAPIQKHDGSPNFRSAGLGLLVGVAAAFVLLMFSPEIQTMTLDLWPGDRVTRLDTVTGTEVHARLDGLDRRVARLRSRLQAKLPQRPYLVVSTSDNKFELRGSGGTLREGVCSTGSYVLLKGGQDQEWMFETPRGAFRILQKKVNPVWAKPDWAFVEEGLPIPPPGAPERFERGALGYYALAIGNGYLIHGTLYQRFLGQPVTHGCIRLGDEDLEAVYRALALGARVYIY